MFSRQKGKRQSSIIIIIIIIITNIVIIIIINIIIIITVFCIVIYDLLHVSYMLHYMFLLELHSNELTHLYCECDFFSFLLFWSIPDHTGCYSTSSVGL